VSWIFLERSHLPERMDLEALDAPTAARILRALERVNAWLGGVSATLSPLKRFSKNWPAGSKIRFLDWGTGGADIPRALVRWCRSRGFKAEVVGVDNNPAIVAYAREACKEYPEIQIAEGDLEREPSSGLRPPSPIGGRQGLGTCPLPLGEGTRRADEGSFDYVLSSLTLHHLSDAQIVSLLKESNRLAKRGIIMNDLKRSARAWAWIWGLSRLTAADPVVQHDGPLSVKRAFTPQELTHLATQAGVTYLTVKTHFGYRLTLAGEKHA